MSAAGSPRPPRAGRNILKVDLYPGQGPGLPMAMTPSRGPILDAKGVAGGRWACLSFRRPCRTPCISRVMPHSPPLRFGEWGYDDSASLPDARLNYLQTLVSTISVPPSQPSTHARLISPRPSVYPISARSSQPSPHPVSTIPAPSSQLSPHARFNYPRPSVSPISARSSIPPHTLLRSKGVCEGMEKIWGGDGM